MLDRGTILVVDDEARMRKLVKDFLVKKDFRVVEAADGEEAIEDADMGGMIEACRWARLACCCDAYKG